MHKERERNLYVHIKTKFSFDVLSLSCNYGAGYGLLNFVLCNIVTLSRAAKTVNLTILYALTDSIRPLTTNESFYVSNST